MWASTRRLHRLSRPTLCIIGFLVIFIYVYQPWSATDFPESQSGISNTGIDQLVTSTFNWGKHPLRYPVLSIKPLPTGRPGTQPKIQHIFTQNGRPDLRRSESHREKVREVFMKCWKNYKKHAWMKDELTPISGKSRTTFGGWAATLVDSLDTLWIMDLKDEFRDAVKSVATVDWANTTSISANMFETTIRHLGGLLAAYDLSHEQVLLFKAIELGDMLYAGFDTPNRMPGFWLDFEQAKEGHLVADYHQPSASPCSLSLEFTRLSQLTGDAKYYDAITRITTVLETNQNSTKLPGMWPTFINLREEIFGEETSFTLGALADSLYEYLPKMHALLGGLDPVYEKLSRYALKTIKDNILFRPMVPDKADILISGTANINNEGHPVLETEGQHLSCFVGGLFALSGRLFEQEEYVDIGSKLAKGCIYVYNAIPTGIMPEIFNMLACDSVKGCEWDEAIWEKDGDQNLPKGFRNARVPSYILRPEAIESVFLLYRITGNEEFRDAAWTMFQAIIKATDSEYGNAAIDDVTVVPPTKHDSMESFWMAETLKYFYLIFSSPDLISLDDYVFNTEAHPLLRLK